MTPSKISSNPWLEGISDWTTFGLEKGLMVYPKDHVTELGNSYPLQHHSAPRNTMGKSWHEGNVTSTLD